MYRYLFILLFPLAACGTGHDRCVAHHAKEIRTIDDLIASTAGNIARGYAIETRDPVNVGFSFCSGNNNVRFCTTNDTAPKRSPVAIDPAAEKRKLAQLKTKRAALQKNRPTSIARCEARITN